MNWVPLQSGMIRTALSQATPHRTCNASWWLVHYHKAAGVPLSLSCTPVRSRPRRISRRSGDQVLDVCQPQAIFHLWLIRASWPA
jgi:hypothetical protein